MKAHLFYAADAGADIPIIYAYDDTSILDIGVPAGWHNGITDRPSLDDSQQVILTGSAAQRADFLELLAEAATAECLRLRALEVGVPA